MSNEEQGSDRKEVGSYATLRKVRILKERLGNDWREQIGKKRIDAAYNDLVGDVRKNLFCKLRPEIKAKLDEMVEENDIKMSEFVEILIDREYDRFVKDRSTVDRDLARLFGR